MAGYLQERGKLYVCMQSLMILIYGIWALFPLGHGSACCEADHELVEGLVFVFNSICTSKTFICQ